MIDGSGFRVQGSGFRVQGSGFRDQGSFVQVEALEAACARIPSTVVACTMGHVQQGMDIPWDVSSWD